MGGEGGSFYSALVKMKTNDPRVVEYSNGGHSANQFR